MLNTTGTRPLSWYDIAPDYLWGEEEDDDDREEESDRQRRRILGCLRSYR